MLFLLIITIFFLLSGIESCPQQGLQQTKTQASKYGLDFDLVKGIGMLSEGSRIALGDDFNIRINIENYDKNPKSGKICIRDDIDSSYGGVDKECQDFYVGSARYEDGNFVKSGVAIVNFPRSGYYNYKNLPIDQNAILYVTTKYNQDLVISSSPEGVQIPGSVNEEEISLNEKPAIIKLSVKKTVAESGLNYKAVFGITLKKILQNAKLYSPDFKREGLTVKAVLGNYPLDCNLEGDFLEFKEEDNTRLIKCSVLLPKEELRYPLMINLIYGAEISKEFKYFIKKEALS